MIGIKNLVKTYGSKHAVYDISFDVAKGTVLGFLGPNGAGKTTTIRMIAGFLRPDCGSIKVGSYDVIQDPVCAQKLIGYMPESTPLYEDMTVNSFLDFVAELRGLEGSQKKRRVQEVLDNCFLTPVRNQSIDTLSKGYRQRTCFAQTLLHDPPVLLLDEPTEGLDPNQKKVVRDMICQMGKEKAIILCTHVLEEVEEICNQVIIISRGRIVIESTPEEIKKQSQYYNVLTVSLSNDKGQAKSIFEGITDVEKVEELSGTTDKRVLQIFPRQGRPIALEVLETAKAQNISIVNIQSNQGRMDDVFQRLTMSQDYQGNSRS